MQNFIILIILLSLQSCDNRRHKKILELKGKIQYLEKGIEVSFIRPSEHHFQAVKNCDDIEMLVLMGSNKTNILNDKIKKIGLIDPKDLKILEYFPNIKWLYLKGMGLDLKKLPLLKGVEEIYLYGHFQNYDYLSNFNNNNFKSLVLSVKKGLPKNLKMSLKEAFGDKLILD